MKIKRDKDLCSKLPRYMDFLHRFRVGASSFYVKKYPSWNTYNCKGKFCLLVYTSSFVKTSITHLSINFTACFHSLYFKNFKKNVPFFFFYLPCQINKRTYQFRIFSAVKVSLTKQFNSVDISCCDKYY